MSALHSACSATGRGASSRLMGCRAPCRSAIRLPGGGAGDIRPAGKCTQTPQGPGDGGGRVSPKCRYAFAPVPQAPSRPSPTPRTRPDNTAGTWACATSCLPLPGGLDRLDPDGGLFHRHLDLALAASPSNLPPSPRPPPDLHRSSHRRRPPTAEHPAAHHDFRARSSRTADAPSATGQTPVGTALDGCFQGVGEHRKARRPVCPDRSTAPGDRGGAVRERVETRNCKSVHFPRIGLGLAAIGADMVAVCVSTS